MRRQRGSRWSSDDLEQHFTNINTLEFLAVLYTLQSFSARFTRKVVMVRSDNSTAVSYINEYGGIKSVVCNALAQRIWCHCMAHSMSILASHMLVF